jgi:hypothetical protein
MAIVVEDGTIVSGANSYVSEADLTAYATARGITITGDEEELLIKAMDYVETLNFIGIKYTRDQPLQWPRSDVVIDYYYKDVDDIPNELKNGLMETALAIDAGNDPMSDIARQKSSVKVGDLAVTYEAGQATTITRKINKAFAKIVKSTSGSFEVSRG